MTAQSALLSTTYGVPQGSILGPVLINLYVNGLSSALPSEVVCHQHADDTRMYTHFPGGGGGYSPIKVTGVLVKFENTPKR